MIVDAPVVKIVKHRVKVTILFSMVRLNLQDRQTDRQTDRHTKRSCAVVIQKWKVTTYNTIE